MSPALCGPAEVEAALRRHGIRFRRISVEAARAHQAAQGLGVEPGAIVKSLVFLLDGRPALVLVGGDRRVDPQRLKSITGARRVMIAPRERVVEATGYPPGAVPPVGHPAPLPVWIDVGLAKHKTVYASGGAIDVMMALSFEDLSRATGGRLVELSAPETQTADNRVGGTENEDRHLDRRG